MTPITSRIQSPHERPVQTPIMRDLIFQYAVPIAQGSFKTQDSYNWPLHPVPLSHELEYRATPMGLAIVAIEDASRINALGMYNHAVYTPVDMEPFNCTAGGRSALTVEIWFETDNLGSQNRLWRLGIGNCTISAFVNTNGSIGFRTRADDGTGLGTESTNDGLIAAGQLNQVVCRWDAGAKAIFMDGVSEKTASRSDQDMTPTAFSLLNSFGDTGQEYGGAWIMARVWNRALSNTEIASLYADPWQTFKAPARWSPSPAAAVGGQPMMLRATTVPGMRQWHPRSR